MVHRCQAPFTSATGAITCPATARLTRDMSRKQTGWAQGKEASICKSFLPLSFPFPSKQNPLAANPASVPKAVPKGPSHPAEVMAVIPLMGSKMNGTLCPKCMRQDGMGGPCGEGKCCWNSPSVGALLGPERAAALAKTCFCQQKPHFTNIQQKTRKWEENPEDDAPLLQRGREPRLRTEVFSLLNSRFK